MGKRPTNPPKDPLKRLPSWHEDMVNEHYRGLSGLYVRQLLDKASAAERSEKGKQTADLRHKARNKVKQAARAFYLQNRGNYRSNKDAAGDLSTRFGEFAFRTYENWVSKWSAE